MDRKAIRRLLLSASREQSHWLVRLYEGTISPALMLVYWTLGPTRPGSIGAEPQFLGHMDQMGQ